jgi:(2Fe-2S) ferredoxin
MDKTPFRCHVFICTNDRQGERTSCADDGGREIRAAIKTAVKSRGWLAPAVRVSQAGCLGLCDDGPNVMIYPQKVLFTGVSLGDVDRIVAEIGRCLED